MTKHDAIMHAQAWNRAAQRLREHAESDPQPISTEYRTGLRVSEALATFLAAEYVSIAEALL